MAGGATTTNMNDTFVAALFQAQLLMELRPSVTGRDYIWWGPTGNSTAFSFTTLGDPGASGGFTEGTDYTTVTDITTGVATATAAEFGLMTTVSDVLMRVSLADAASVSGGTLTRSTLEKWETDVAGVADGMTSATTAASTLTVDDLLRAVSAIEQRDAATGALVAYLHPKQSGELRNDIASTTAIVTAGQAGNVPTGPVVGETNSRGDFGSLFGVDIRQTSLVASSSSLRQGSVFVKGQVIGGYELWGPRIETERRASLRGIYVVSSACYGLAAVETVNRGQMLRSAA